MSRWGEKTIPIRGSRFAQTLQTVASVRASMWPFSPLHLSATCPIGNLCRSVISHTENIRHRHVAPLPACARARGPLTAAIARTTNQASRTTRSVHAVATCSIGRLVSRILSLSLSFSLFLRAPHRTDLRSYDLTHSWTWRLAQKLVCALAARVRYTSFLSFQYTRYTPCATAIYLDRLMRSENLLLASQYHNYFISGSLIIRLFTAALRLRLFLPTFSPATRFSSLSFESLRVSKAFFIFASLPLEPRVSLDSLHFVNNATFVRPERAWSRTARRFRDYFIVRVSTRVWPRPSLTHDR